MDSDLEVEAAYYARKCGITRDEALRTIKEAHAPKPSFVGKEGRKGK
ncbi:hypothetical protein [Mesorhizobium sp. B2-3-5]|nr:hypothetical protein [Mesorhizobium sp. B2-3-5]